MCFLRNIGGGYGKGVSKRLDPRLREDDKRGKVEINWFLLVSLGGFVYTGSAFGLYFR